MTDVVYQITALGHAIVDVIAPATDNFLAEQDLTKGAMTLIDGLRAKSLYGAMAAGVETSGGSAGNTIAGVASFGVKTAYIGKVADDQLGEVFTHDLRAMGARFDTPFMQGGPATARCLINVTEDGQRTMATFLGAAALLGPSDVDEALIKASGIVYLEGYLFDSPTGRAAFEAACQIAGEAGRLRAITLSDVFVADRWRDDLKTFIAAHIDIVFANEAELLSLYQTSDFELAISELSKITKLAAVTRSEHGSVVVSGETRHLVPIYPVAKLVDTTGAGDQYAAGFMTGLALGKPLDVCGRLGALAASEVISHYGPRPQVSLRDLAQQHGLI